jgi:hypothetical protein
MEPDLLRDTFRASDSAEGRGITPSQAILLNARRPQSRKALPVSRAAFNR